MVLPLCSDHGHVSLATFIPTGTHNQNIQVYDLASLDHECTLSGHIGIVTVLRVTESPYGVYMFSGSSDATVQVRHNSLNYIDVCTFSENSQGEYYCMCISQTLKHT